MKGPSDRFQLPSDGPQLTERHSRRTRVAGCGQRTTAELLVSPVWRAAQQLGHEGYVGDGQTQSLDTGQTLLVCERRRLGTGRDGIRWFTDGFTGRNTLIRPSTGYLHNVSMGPHKHVVGCTTAVLCSVHRVHHYYSICRYKTDVCSISS